MSWRIHLTHQAIKALHILPGKSPVLLVWIQYNHALHYDLETGTALGDYKVPQMPPFAPQSERWQEFVNALVGPDQRHYLPYLRTPYSDIFVTDDGKMRVYNNNSSQLLLDLNGTFEAVALEKTDYLLDMDLDRALGMIVGLDTSRHLHIYQQNLRVGRFDIDLSTDPDTRASVTVSRGGGNIFATDGHTLVITDSGGNVLKRKTMHYNIGRLTCSPGGGMLAVSDSQTGVIRLYNAETLELTHQKFAIDLMARASQVQLIADLPHMGTVVSQLIAYNRGILAFAMSGVICVSHVSDMDELPRQSALL